MARPHCAFDGSEELKEKAEKRHKGVTETCRREDEEERRKASGRERRGVVHCSVHPPSQLVCLLSILVRALPDDIPSRS